MVVGSSPTWPIRRYDPQVSATGRSKAEQGEATRLALIGAARELFAERGYSGVGTEEVVRVAEVTRGALYHHFKDKKDLFRAVFEQVEQETVAKVASQMHNTEDAAEFLDAGMMAYLEACSDPRLARIGLIEAPAVLGRSEWLEIGSRYGLGLVTSGLRQAVDTGLIEPQPVEPLARLLFAALVEAGSEVAAQPGDDARLAETQRALLALVHGLHARG